MLDSSTIKGYVYGGSAGLAAPIVMGSSAQISDFVNSGVNFNPLSNPALPLYYELTYVDGGQTLRFVTNTSYTAQECQPNTGRFRVTIDRILCTKTNKPLNPRAKLYGNIAISGFVREPRPGRLNNKRAVPGGTIQLRSKSNPIYLKEGDDFQIGQSKVLTFTGMANTDPEDAFLVINPNLYEKDTAASDEMSVPNLQVPLSDALTPQMPSGNDLPHIFINDKGRFKFKLYYTIETVQ